MVSPTQDSFHPKITLLVFGISLMCSTLVIAIFLTIRFQCREIGDRVSLRLIAWLSLSNILVIVFQIWSRSIEPANTTYCTFSAWGLIFSKLVFVFLSCSISLNLQFIFVHRLRKLKRFEFCYVFVSIVGAFILSMVTMPFGITGYTANGDPKCWFHERNTTGPMLWEVGSFLVWMILGLLYCLGSFIWIFIQLSVQRGKLARMLVSAISPQATSLTQHDKLINFTATRILFQVLVAPVSLTIFVVLEILSFFGQEATPDVKFLSLLFVSLQGILLLSVFTFDPALRLAWLQLRKNMARKYFQEADYSITRDEWKRRTISWIIPNAQVLAIETKSSSRPISQSRKRTDLVYWI
ncbi:hypothetical protein K493DRAFT_385374 [Basidiobolus meristosporus CBS 931.73]|uniref:G-protein coupled receptors family 2 profile 2 domain-containing protein n=1 Tax=Basidiobolus meristosporus CBS 931.73 TaxID=1314790 RepID=A0A1Y1XST1_9FUNG|nr:hypothetical protein K493DRAFT_385374 [Basidiobolus meristosporus CBS 931.73]|eukprot:ORX88364.1 hypothetical protein K493DRAFT_385374 [Basidiobolus meristosporus CBS 931.73]